MSLTANPGVDQGTTTVNFSENAIRVFQSRYLDRDEHNNFKETPEQLLWRVAESVAGVEQDSDQAADWANKFFQLMAERRFLPNSPTLMNAGRRLGLLSACFVLPVTDDLEGITKTQRDLALVQRAGGGTGFTFDLLRPCGAFIASSGGQSSGPISFWRAYSETTNAIQQGAFRRGANMAMMSMTHCDILKFIFAKQDLNQFTNYNISVKITDEWMQTLESNPTKPHILIDHKGRRYMIPKRILDVCRQAVQASSTDPAKRTAIDTCYKLSDLVREEQAGDWKNESLVSVGDMAKLIFSHAHATGEPGVLFIDRIRETEPTPHKGKIEATNPCAEQPLLPNEACNLGSLNLSEYVAPVYLSVESLNQITSVQRERAVDWSRLANDIRTAVRFLDNVISINRYPTPEIAEMCQHTRKIGLGIMGFADVLIKLGIKYDSIEGLAWAERLMGFVNEHAIKCSSELAEERGAFDWWEGSRWHQKGIKLRNAEVTTIAPTGTLSIIADCTGAAEPVFGYAFFRNVLDGQRLVQGNLLFEAIARKRGFWSEALMKKVAVNGSIVALSEVPRDIREVFVCAHDVSPEYHVRIQAALQKHVTNSLSKTVNMDHNATVDDVMNAYMLAWQLGCKGVTIYRDGCRENQPMELATAVKTKIVLEPEETPEVCSSVRVRRKTVFGTMHVQIVVNPSTGRESEVFAQLGKGGDVANTDLEAVSRMISIFLRVGGDFKAVINQLVGIGSVLQGDSGKATSLGNDLGLVLLRYWDLKNKHGLKSLLLGEVDINEAPKIAPPTVVKKEKRVKNEDDATQFVKRMNDRQHRSGHRLICKYCKDPDATVVMIAGCPVCQSCGESNCIST